MANINNTFASAPLDPRKELLTPTVNTDFTLPSSGIKAGTSVLMLNNGANSGNYPVVTLKSSNGDVVRQVFAQTGATVVALQDNPTTALHWSKADAAGDTQTLTPVGSIIAYNPGYYTNGSNGGFTAVGPLANSVAAVNTYLPSTWRVCDGQALNDAASPIFNGASRFLPNLTDSRFLAGVTSAGTTGGSSTTSISHTHDVTSNVTVASHPDHTHSVTSNVSVANHSDHWHSFDGVGARTFVAGSGLGYTNGGSVLSQAALQSYVTSNTLYGAGSPITHTVTNNAVTSGGTTALSHVPTNNTVTSTAPSVSTAPILPTYLTTFYIMRVK